MLHRYQFDETMQSLDSLGAVSLAPWEDEPGVNVSIAKMCLVPFTDEVALISNNGSVRIFSWAIEQFKFVLLVTCAFIAAHRLLQAIYC